MYKLPGKFLIISFCLFVFSSYKTPVTKQNAQPKNVLRTIIIDPGHGLPDPGAYGSFTNESAKALQIALKLGEQLKQNLPNTKIIFTRTDEYLPDHLSNINASLKRRAEIANENHGDLFISIHLNSAQERTRSELVGHRNETYYTYTGKGKKRKKIAHTRSVPVYKSYKIGCDAEGTEVYIWAVGKADQKKNM